MCGDRREQSCRHPGRPVGCCAGPALRRRSDAAMPARGPSGAQTPCIRVRDRAGDVGPRRLAVRGAVRGPWDLDGAQPGSGCNAAVAESAGPHRVCARESRQLQPVLRRRPAPRKLRRALRGGGAPMHGSLGRAHDAASPVLAGAVHGALGGVRHRVRDAESSVRFSARTPDGCRLELVGRVPAAQRQGRRDGHVGRGRGQRAPAAKLLRQRLLELAWQPRGVRLGVHDVAGRARPQLGRRGDPVCGGWGLHRADHRAAQPLVRDESGAGQGLQRGADAQRA
mmetsp:Transcript_505/g.1090  ORF Transcript_505/g.1090 Transcript_505/m.1090 type:complete len:282 (+) Transcript_505:1156-2001(+)